MIKTAQCIFFSEYENFFYAKNNTPVLESVENGTEVSNGKSICSNIFLNNSETVTISIRNTSDGKNNDDDEEEKNATIKYFRKADSGRLSTAAIVLMSIFIPIAVIGSLIAAILLTRKPNINSYIKDPSADTSVNKF